MPADPAEMVAVAVAEDHRLDRPLARFGFDRVGEQLPPRRRGFFGQQRIDDDPPALAADDRHHRNIVTAQLPDLVRHHLEQPMHRVQPRLPPQRRVHRVGRHLGVEKGIGPPVPHRLAVLVQNHPARNFGELAAHRIRLVARIIERQAFREFGLRGARRLARGVLRDGGKGQGAGEQQGGQSAHLFSPPYFGRSLRRGPPLGKHRRMTETLDPADRLAQPHRRQRSAGARRGGWRW